MKEKIYIFDTTLRDGEQSPGASLTSRQKLEIALQLEKLGVDVIEAGFPIASPDDKEAVKVVAKNVKRCQVAGLCRARKEDIDACIEALEPLRRKGLARVHTFIATSEIHMKYKLKMLPEDVIDAAVAAVKYASKFTENIEFSCEDAGRSEIDFLCKIIESVIKAGAKVINIPDTVGYTMPQEYGEIFRKITNRVPNIDKCILSTHCHNDLGLAVANSISAVLSGARQIECTINGIGERAGNASLEEVVMIINTRKDFFKNLYTNINTREIYSTSKMVSNFTGISVQPNKAIVGSNAFRHEAGIHQDGILKKRQTYEIMSAEEVGVPSSELVLGKHSGRHALEKKLKQLGYNLDKKTIEKVFHKFKELCDKKKYIFDEDIFALVNEEVGRRESNFELKYFHINSGSGVLPTATIVLGLKYKGEEKIFREVEFGDGPIDAAYKAIDKIMSSILKVSSLPKLIDYSLKAISSGKDAQGEVMVKLEYEKVTFTGRGVSTDIIEASIKAYLSAMNNFLVNKKSDKKLKICL